MTSTSATVDRYELLQEIGRGESGVVYRACDRLTGRDVAVKVFRHRSHSGRRREELAARLEREARLLARVRHPAVVRVIEARVTDEGAWLVTEYVEGESLQHRLRRRERLEVDEAVSLTIQASRALDCAHRQGIVHRDIKPANLLVTDDGTLKITDFGVAGELGAMARVAGGRGYFLGTPAYVAPEQWQGRPIDGRADLYSLAVVLYRCLCGARPFEGRTVREIVYRSLHELPVPPSARGLQVPAELDAFCLRALAKDPAQRFPDGEAMAVALESIALPRPGEQKGRPFAAGIDDPMERTWRRLPVHKVRRWTRLRSVALAVGVVLALFVGVGWPQREAWLAHFAPPHHVSPVVAGRPSGEEVMARELPSVGQGETPLISSGGESSQVVAAAELPPAISRPAPRTETYRLPDRRLLEKYARREARAKSRRPARRPPPSASTVALALPRSADPPAREPPAASTPRPKVSEAKPTVALVREKSPPVVRQPSPVATADPAKASSRGELTVYHELEEGLVEVLVDGRSAARVRFGPTRGDRPGKPVTAFFKLPRGEHQIELRVLSASRGIEVRAQIRGDGSVGALSRVFSLRREHRRWSLDERVP